MGARGRGCGAWALVAALLLAGCLPTRVTKDWQPLKPRVPANNFQLASLAGGEVSLEALRGRIVVMEFWATWCPPCRFSLPSLETIARRYRDRGVTVLLINQGESEEQVRRWAAQRFGASTILLDANSFLSEVYQVQGYPRLFIVDPQGLLAYTHAGYGGGMERNLTLILDDMLAHASPQED